MQAEDQAWVVVKHKDQSHVWLELMAQSACGSGCGASGVGCQTNAFGNLLHRQPLLKIPNNFSHPIVIGDQLLVSLDAGSVIKMAFWAYGLPLVALLLGLYLGEMLSGDGLAFIMGLTFMSTIWIILNRLSVHVIPKIIEIRSLEVH